MSDLLPRAFRPVLVHRHRGRGRRIRSVLAGRRRPRSIRVAISDQSQSEARRRRTENRADVGRPSLCGLAQVPARQLRGLLGFPGVASPISNPNAKFGMQFYHHKDPVRPVLQFFDYDAYDGGGYSLGALSRINGVSWLLDRVCPCCRRRQPVGLRVAEIGRPIPHRRVHRRHSPQRPMPPTTRMNCRISSTPITASTQPPRTSSAAPIFDSSSMASGIAPEDIYPEVTGHFQELGVRLAAGVGPPDRGEGRPGRSPQHSLRRGDTHSDRIAQAQGRPLNR